MRITISLCLTAALITSACNQKDPKIASTENSDAAANTSSPAPTSEETTAIVEKTITGNRTIQIPKKHIEEMERNRLRKPDSIDDPNIQELRRLGRLSPEEREKEAQARIKKAEATFANKVS